MRTSAPSPPSVSAGSRAAPSAQAAWQRALATAHLMLYDVHWTPAIVTELGGAKGGIRVGLADGRTLPLNVRVGKTLQALKLYDVIYVDVSKTGARAELLWCKAQRSCWKTRPERS